MRKLSLVWPKHSVGRRVTGVPHGINVDLCTPALQCTSHGRGGYQDPALPDVVLRCVSCASLRIFCASRRISSHSRCLRHTRVGMCDPVGLILWHTRLFGFVFTTLATWASGTGSSSGCAMARGMPHKQHRPGSTSPGRAQRRHFTRDRLFQHGYPDTG